MRNLYGYPDVGRFGLGHSMLAWARCEIWCRQNGARMLGPQWFRPRIGPYIRRERDKREYFKLFTNKNYIRSPMRDFLLLVNRKVDFGSLSEYEISKISEKQNLIVVFKNESTSNFEKNFHEIKGFSQEIYCAFRDMVKSDYLPKKVSEPYIAIHVRLGDFARFDISRAQHGVHNQRLPIEWYCESLLALRRALGVTLPARIYSDGADDEILPLLKIPGVQRAEDAESVTHMLEMALSSAIIGAGSNFNLWAAFFGQVPRVVYPQQGIVVVNDDPDREVSYFHDEILSDRFLSHIRYKLIQAGARA